jgi:D-glycerate 3-kinase
MADSVDTLMVKRAAARRPNRRGFRAADVEVLAGTIAVRRASARRRGPLLVGLSGLPGSGKSTLAAQVARALGARGHETLVLALDDFYLGRRERSRLARDTHPLFATRGPAGTHDIARLSEVLDELRDARVPPSLPRFDRLRDRRLPPSRWRRPARAPDVGVHEGGGVGVAGLSSAELMRAPNALERNEDADARWRRAVNRELGGPYARAWRRLDLLVALLAPDLDAMRRWRTDAEREMALARGARGMSRTELARFLQHYERWAAHALRVLPDSADVVWRLDRRHVPQVCSSR